MCALQTCRGQFCPAHRLPSTHTCRTTPGASASQAASSRFPAASPAGLAALKRAAVSASNAGRQASTQAKATTTSKQGEPSTSSATGSSTKGTSLFQEIKTDRCEPSSFISLSPEPTVSLTNRPPTNLPRFAIPDPTKKWVPRSIFASA